MEPLTWGLLASVTVQEGIKFLYGQLKEAIDRARKKTPEATCAEPPKASFATAPDQLRLSPLDLLGHEVVGDALVTRIAPFVDSAPGRDPDPDVLAAVSALRALIESLSGERFTFAGEAARSAPITKVDVTIKHIREATVVGVEAKVASGRDYEVVAKVDEVGPGSCFTVFKET